MLEYMGEIMTNVNVFNEGLAVPIIAICIGLGIAMTNDRDVWPLSIAVMLLGFGIMFRSTWYSWGIFATATILLVFAFIPKKKYIGD